MPTTDPFLLAEKKRCKNAHKSMHQKTIHQLANQIVDSYQSIIVPQLSQLPPIVNPMQSM